MKSILYVGATLMIGAGIYGFVDFKKTNRNKEFTKMYDSKKVTELTATPLKINSAENAVVTKEIFAEEKIATVKDQTIKEEKTLQKKKPGTVKKKKLNYKLFSRAPLKRRYIDKEFKAETLKVIEPGKMVQKNFPGENKEQ